MICVSIAERTTETCLKALEGLDFAEIRMEGMDLTTEDIRTIFSQRLILMATCRPGVLEDGKRRGLLISAVEAGARYVDIEVGSDSRYRQPIVDAARAHGCQVVMSFHDYKKTPPLKTLKQIIALCFAEGGDVAKIACKVHSERDNARLLSLFDREKPGSDLVVVGMGEQGKITRIVAPFLGSPFTYASLAEGKETAAGQVSKNRLESIMRSIREI
ncbi:MAG: 3-dehydroquinate dehydratase [Syntrophorhabdus sp. PtaU1.Bin153]|nr:MAG: 3-dehydroquinate dehydratase [Syntrophorhabdus sp. PtaU1.Bin153]